MLFREVTGVTTSKITVFLRTFGVLMFTLMIFVLSLGVIAAESEEYTKQQRLEQTVYLVNNDYAAAVDGVLSVIDKDNKNVVPYIKDSVQYFPLRFVCESLGYTVDWNEQSRTVLIKSQDVIISTLEIDSAVSQSKAQITNSRTMVSEELLLTIVDCSVYSVDNGTHVIYKSGIEWMPDRQAEKDALSAMQYVMMPFFRMFIN